MRGPVPRDRPTYAKTERQSVVRARLIPNGAGSGDPALQRMSARLPQGMARDRPSPYGEGEAAWQTVARGPVPRDLSCAPGHGEGQALALR